MWLPDTHRSHHPRGRRTFPRPSPGTHRSHHPRVPCSHPLYHSNNSNGAPHPARCQTVDYEACRRRTSLSCKMQPLPVNQLSSSNVCEVDEPSISFVPFFRSNDITTNRTLQPINCGQFTIFNAITKSTQRYLSGHPSNNVRENFDLKFLNLPQVMRLM